MKRLICMLLLIPSVAFAGLEHDGTDDLVSYADSTDWFFSGNFTVWARVEVFTFGTRQAILGQSDHVSNRNRSGRGWPPNSFCFRNRSVLGGAGGSDILSAGLGGILPSETRGEDAP